MNQEEEIKLFKRHIGHLITYRDGWKNNQPVRRTGKVLRVSADRFGVKVWVEDSLFPRTIYTDSLISCDCGIH